MSVLISEHFRRKNWKEYQSHKKWGWGTDSVRSEKNVKHLALDWANSLLA